MQAYFKSDPISAAEIDAISRHVEASTTELIAKCKVYKPAKLIGSAGAFESFAGMLMIQKNKPAKDISSGVIDYDQYLQLSGRLIASTHEQRMQMDALPPVRVDMIVIAALLLNYVLEQTGIKVLNLSTNDLKMGVLAQLQEDYNLDSSL